MSAERFVPLAGSFRAPLPGAEPVTDRDPDERLTITVYLRPASTASSPVGRKHEARLPPSDRPTLSRPKHEEDPGADPDLAAVAEWASRHGLSVVQQSPASRTLQLAGTVRAFGQAFGVQLQTWRYRGHEYRDRIGPLHVPESLSAVVTAVLGLDSRPLEHHTLEGPPGPFRHGRRA
jgi:kumamolisin